MCVFGWAPALRCQLIAIVDVLRQAGGRWRRPSTVTWRAGNACRGWRRTRAPAGARRGAGGQRVGAQVGRRRWSSCRAGVRWRWSLRRACRRPTAPNRRAPAGRWCRAGRWPAARRRAALRAGRCRPGVRRDGAGSTHHGGHLWDRWRQRCGLQRMPLPARVSTTALAGAAPPACRPASGRCVEARRDGGIDPAERREIHGAASSGPAAWVSCGCSAAARRRARSTDLKPWSRPSGRRWRRRPVRRPVGAGRVARRRPSAGSRRRPASRTGRCRRSRSAPGGWRRCGSAPGCAPAEALGCRTGRPPRPCWRRSSLLMLGHADRQQRCR